MRKLLLIVGLAPVALLAGCGSSNSSGMGSGNFSNSNFNGSYVYQIWGSDPQSGNSYREAGVVTADGNGHITGGVDDVEGVGISSSFGNAISGGTYSINHDGTGTATINGAGFSTINLQITLVSSSKVYLEPVQGGSGSSIFPLNGAGIAEQQNQSVIGTTPSGTYTFKLHDVQSLLGQADNVGVFTSTTSGAVTGTEDVNRNGTVSQLLTFTGTFSAPTGNGRGTVTFTDTTPVTNTYEYYIVDGNNIRFLAADSSTVGLGRAEMQVGAPFTDPLSGNSYAFGARGDDPANGAGAVNTVGTLSFSAGTVAGGAFDQVKDDVSLVDVPLTGGTYTVSANGRVLVTLNPQGGAPISEIFWMVSPSRAFFLVNDPTMVEDGTADQQTSASFSNSSLNGQFAFVMDGYDDVQNVLVDRVGWIQWNGSGGLKLSEAVNDSGNVSGSGTITGTYSVTSNGRVAASVSGLGSSNSDVIVYLVSGSQGYMLENDNGVEVLGVTQAQAP